MNESTDMPALPSRHAMTARLLPEMGGRYEQIHSAPPPEVLARLTASNLHQYLIVRSGDTLFASFEHRGPDLAADLAAFRADPAMRDWMAITDACLEPLDDESGRRWSAAKEVFWAS